MHFKTKIEKIDSNIWTYIIRVPQPISDKILKQSTKRVVCKINDVLEIQCALMGYGDGTYFINLNKEIRTKISKNGISELDIKLSIDDSEYGMPFPEELKELLELDDEGNKYFQNLTKGKKRSLIYIIGKPKNIDIRIRKAITIVNYLKSTNGKLDFKELNEALKLKNSHNL